MQYVLKIKLEKQRWWRKQV